MTPTSLNPFKAALTNGATPLGTWLMSGTPSTAEALGHAGFDWLVVDMEHVPIEFRDAWHILQAIAGTPAQAVVRLAWNDPVLVKRALDIGAQTLMFPFVQNVEEAQHAVRAAKYPPAGGRGYAAMHRGSRYGTWATYAQDANEFVACIIQLETAEAIAQLEQIAAVDGVDALFVGPGDLSVALGHPGDLTHADVQTHLREAARRAGAVGKPIGIVGPHPEMVKRFIEYGYSFVAVASDMGMMMRQAGNFLKELRGGLTVAVTAGPY